MPPITPRPRRHVRRILLVLAGVAAMIGLPGTASAAVPAHPAAPASASTRQAVVLVSTSQATVPASAARLQVPMGAAAARLSARAAATGGLCSVPGIGDIGGLLGFCAAGSGLLGVLNNICQPSPPTPEPATGGIDALIRPPGAPPRQAAPTAGPAATATGPTPPHSAVGGKPVTLYDSYGMAGQSWAAFDLGCSDMASLIGNNIAGVVFDAAKAIDRVTITVYQSAAGSGILAWLTSAVDRLISSLGNAIYFPYLAPVVILGAIWLAWQGLVRKRATRTIEGTLWMVIACAAAIWLIGRPADFTGFGKSVSDGITQTLNVAFAKLPAPEQSSCVPLGRTDPQTPQTSNFSFSPGNGIVDTNASELWTVLVCKPWLDGEFGTTAFSPPGKGHPTVVNLYGRQLLWAQAVAANEQPTAAVVTAKQDTYVGIANSIKNNQPGVYPLFQGKQWTTRLEIAFAAVFAALLAGVLVLLIAITLIVLKLGFLLLLVAGPFFLIVGTHPGFGRVIALRWGELLIGVLLKQAALALVLSVLLYAYSLIMGTSDAVLPWALKILMISLVTVAVFIYRKPFTHLFSAVGYGVIGSRDRAETQLAYASGGAARNTLDAASVAIPGFAAYRAARWARRNPAQAASLAAQVATAGATAGLAGAAAAGATTATPGAGGEAGPPGPPEAGPGDAAQPRADASPGFSGRGRARPGADGPSGRTPPPLDLPPRGGEDPPRPRSGWARGRADGAGRPRDGAQAPAGNGARGRTAPDGSGMPQASGASPGDGRTRAPAVPPGGIYRSGPSRPAWPGSAPRPAHGGRPPRPAQRTPAPGASASRSGGPVPRAPGPLAARPPGQSPSARRDGSAGQLPPPAPGLPPTAGSRSDDAAGPPGPFWLRPIRRRK